MKREKVTEKKEDGTNTFLMGCTRTGMSHSQIGLGKSKIALEMAKKMDSFILKEKIKTVFWGTMCVCMWMFIGGIISLLTFCGCLK